MQRWVVGNEGDPDNGLWTLIHAETAQQAVDEWWRIYELGDDDPDIKLVVSEWNETANQCRVAETSCRLRRTTLNEIKPPASAQARPT